MSSIAAPNSNRPRRANLAHVHHVKHHLRRSGYPDLRGIECEWDGQVLTLHGTVSSYYLKQLAQVLAREQLRDHVKIDNQVKVS